jgi:hypothetical protein
MNSIYRRTLACAVLSSVSFSWLLAAAQVTRKPVATIRRVAVLGGSQDFEVEVTASQPVTPQTQVIAGPDRLVIDFRDAMPSSDLHNIAVNRGQVSGIRVGLFSANPPVTRVVLDLKTPQPYQVFSSGKSVMVKLNGSGAQASMMGGAHLATVSRTVVPATAAAIPAPRVEVEFQNGRMTIWADNASLAEVLNAVHRRTGADIPIPPGAEQEQVSISLGPAPARDVMAALLNGSRFNFVLVGDANDPTQLKNVVLTPRGAGVSQPATYTPPPPTEAAVEPPAQPSQAQAMEQGGSDPQPQPPQQPPQQQ